MPQMRHVAEEIPQKNKKNPTFFNLFRYSRGRKNYVSTLLYSQIPEATEVHNLNGRVSYIEVKRRKPRFDDHDFDYDED